ncbi:MAG: acyl carrier protein [Sterolibacteriaceae bacterium]|nr:acyl carrier protein [Candidatus Methylophosphatis haderslevensis]
MTERKRIRAYILENFMFTDDESALNDGESLLTKGVIDSVGALEITQFIEETFNIKVKEDEMLPENLDSVDNIVAFVRRTQTALS